MLQNLVWDGLRESLSRWTGSHHVRYEGFAAQLRLTTDVPISYLHGQPFALTDRKHLVLSWEIRLRSLCTPSVIDS